MSQISSLRGSQLLLCALALPGCYTTTVSSGKPAAKADIEYDESGTTASSWASRS